MATTPRLGMRDPQGADAFAIAADLSTNFNILDKALIWQKGTLAARPAANAVKEGTVYYTTDTKKLYHSDAVEWTLISDPFFTGTLGARPAANTVPAGARYRATDTGDLSMSDGAAWFTLTPAAAVAWFVKRSSTGALPNGMTRIDTFNTEVFDLGASFATDRFTAPVKGLYRVGARTLVNTGAGAGSWGLFVQLSGGAYSSLDYIYGGANALIRMTGELLIQMNAGQYLDLYVQNTTGVAGTLQADSQFHGHLLAQLP